MGVGSWQARGARLLLTWVQALLGFLGVGGGFFPVKIWFDLKTRRPLTAAVAVLLVGMETGGAAMRDGSCRLDFA